MFAALLGNFYGTEGFPPGYLSSDYGHEVRGPTSESSPPRPYIFFLFLSRRQHYQLCQVHRQRRSGTLFLTCPSLSQRNSANEMLWGTDAERAAWTKTTCHNCFMISLSHTHTHGHVEASWAAVVCVFVFMQTQ